MARYYQKPQSPILDLTPQYPVEFYSKLIDQVQQNRNQAGATKAAFMTDAQGQKFIDQAARDKAIALAQDPLEKAMDRDFVTPASMAKAVIKASDAISPWKNINKVHVEQAEREQKLRDALGANYIGNSVINKPIMNPDGSYVNADDLQVIAGNREDLIKAAQEKFGNLAAKTRDSFGNWYSILDGKAYEREKTTKKGLYEEEINDMIKRGDWEQLKESMPELARAAEAQFGKEGVNDFFKNEFSTWAHGNLNREYSKDRQLMNNPGWKERSGFTPNGAKLRAESYDRGQTAIERDKSNINAARAYVDPSSQSIKNNWLYNIKAIGELKFLEDMIAKRYTGDPTARFNPPYTLFTNEDFIVSEKKGKEVFNQLKDKYKSVYNSITAEEIKKYMPEFDRDADSPRSEEDIKKLQKAREKVFLDKVEILESTAYSPRTSYDLKSSDVDAGIHRAIELGTKKNKKVISENGNEEALEDFYKKDNVNKYLISNDGNLEIVKEGKPYLLDVFDADGNGTGVIGDRSEEILKVQRKLYNAIWATDDEIFKERITYGNNPQPIPVPGYDGMGIPVYSVTRNSQIGQPNIIHVTYIDPATGKPHTDDNGNPISYKTTLNEIAQNTGEMLKYVNPNPKDNN